MHWRVARYLRSSLGTSWSPGLAGGLALSIPSEFRLLTQRREECTVMSRNSPRGQGSPKILPMLNVDGAGMNGASVSFHRMWYIRKR